MVSFDLAETEQPPFGFAIEAKQKSYGAIDAIAPSHIHRTASPQFSPPWSLLNNDPLKRELPRGFCSAVYNCVGVVKRHVYIKIATRF
jgi:hypothetical protein